MSVVQAVSRLGHAPRMCHLHRVASGLCVLVGRLLLRWIRAMPDFAHFLTSCLFTTVPGRVSLPYWRLLQGFSANRFAGEP